MSPRNGYCPLARNKVLKNSIVNLVAEKLGKTPAQVTLRWGLQMGHRVVPKISVRACQEGFSFFWTEKLVPGTGFVHETSGAYRTLEEL
ncbi:unnamed protein product [Prunus armeniaca]|uniref:NADP-dependent oxidoreductase domain-containing protein n=1 Tax=Prunus armeniaca TaxID=36596 RepID=A0A6J5V9Y1_PRUAR|nr:unnamed protein product [Prunus armeniaca]